MYDRALKTDTGLDYSDEEYDTHIATDETLRHLTDEEKEKRKLNLENIQKALKKAQDKVDKFISGEYSQPYTEKMLFFLDEDLHK
jgi:phage gp36-like protein